MYVCIDTSHVYTYVRYMYMCICICTVYMHVCCDYV